MIQKTLLIVDDDADIREMLGNYFAKESYKVDFACDGKQGLEKAREFCKIFTSLKGHLKFQVRFRGKRCLRKKSSKILSASSSSPEISSTRICSSNPPLALISSPYDFPSCLREYSMTELATCIVLFFSVFKKSLLSV